MTVSSAAASVFAASRQNFQSRKPTAMGLVDYLEQCKTDKMTYASAAGRLLDAIGKPEIIDTQKDPRLGRIHGNKTIARYAAFSDFYGMDETIMQIVSFLRHAEQNLEEGKQVLYLLGPVGSAKSSLAERLKALMEKNPIYVLADEDGNMSPTFESPLGLFSDPNSMDAVNREFDVPKRYMKGALSPWAAKRLEEYKGNVARFKVVKVYPSIQNQIGIAKTEPGDENNQDITSLVGKVDIRKLEEFSQNDPDAYSFSGALNRTTQGMMEFVEMFKAPIKMLHPLLTATQEGNYAGNENVGNIPFRGLILAHSNEAEWQTFRNNKNNEAFIDRIQVVKVAYNLHLTEEVEIYRKMLDGSELAKAPCAPETLEMMAMFAVMSRLVADEKVKPESKARIYNGEALKGKLASSSTKTFQTLRDEAGQDEGMNGISTRFSFKTLSAVFNFEAMAGGPVEADPVHLLYVLEQRVRKEQFPPDVEKKYIGFIKEVLAPNYKEFIGNEIQRAYLETYADYGQNLFDRYIDYADAWLEDSEFKDPDTGTLLTRAQLEAELAKIEKPAGIVNAKDFRNEVVKYVLRVRGQNAGKNPDWTSYEKIRDVIEKRLFNKMDDIMPIISFGKKRSEEEDQKHQAFVARMATNGYTPRQVRRMVEWYGKALNVA